MHPAFVVTIAILIGTLITNTLLDLALSINSNNFALNAILKCSVASKNPVQWVRATTLRLLSIENRSFIPQTLSSSPIVRGYFDEIPYRRGMRPSTSGINPHRQTTQIPPKDKKMYNRLRSLVLQQHNKLQDRTYLSYETYTSSQTSVTMYGCHRHFYKTHYYGEIVQVGAEDCSVMVNLHPTDAEVLISAGWAERHPLSREKRSVFNHLLTFWAPRPPASTIVYAPRDEFELKFMNDIIAAAIWWVGGVDSRIQELSCL